MDADLKARFSDLIGDLEKELPYAAALYKKTSGTRINLNRVQEAAEPEDPSEGAVITLWNGQSFFEFATNQLSWPSFRSSVLDWARFAKSQIDPDRPKSDLDPGPPLHRDFLGPVDEGVAQKPLSEKIDRAREILQQTLRDMAVANAMVLTGHQIHEDLFTNRTKVLSQKISRTDTMLIVFVTDGQKTSEIHAGLSKNGGPSRTQFTPDQIGSLVEDGKRLLNTDRLVPGLYDIVTDPEWSGIIAHECFGHGMETDLYVRERALSQSFIGKPIASTLVNMWDDPSLIDEAGGYFFDDEGQLATGTHIIRNGILERGLTDMASAHKLKIIRSANGRRESYQRKAYARMTNTFFDAGSSRKDDMIRSIHNGLYLRYATNGMEDPQAWGIQVEGLWAEEIKNGCLTGRIFSPVIMTGFVPELLKSITMVGNDRWISGLGMCGKGHKEWVKNTTGGPHLKMRARLA